MSKIEMINQEISKGVKQAQSELSAFIEQSISTKQLT